ncbi:MAG: response regulator [Sphingomicrobium sp.]
MHALIIEDEAFVAMSIEGILRECGFTSFVIAISAGEAIAAARLKCPDLISADVDLRPGSGIDAVNDICSGPTIPIIFVTGTPDEARQRMPDHPLVLKPFTPDDVKEAVRLAMGENSVSGHKSRADLAWITQRVDEFVSAGRPAPFCDDCIAAALEFCLATEARSVTEALGSTGDFSRKQDQCSGCQEPKMVIRRL